MTAVEAPEHMAFELAVKLAVELLVDLLILAELAELVVRFAELLAEQVVRQGFAADASMYQ